MENKQTSTRNRGVILDRACVRARCYEVGIKSLAQLQINYLKYTEKANLGGSTDSADKAWLGKKLDKKRAEIIADILGLGADYTKLMTPPEPPWLSLLRDGDRTQMPVEIVPEDTHLGLIRFGWEQEQQELPEFANGSFWRLRLRTQLNKPKMFAILRSEQEFAQIAPIAYPGFELSKSGGELLYPAGQPLQFSPNYAPGTRELIVVIAEQLPVSPLTPDDNYLKSQSELHTIAAQILAQEKPLEVSRLRFRLL